MVFVKQVELRRNVAPMSVKNKKLVYAFCIVLCMPLKYVYKLSWA